MSDQPILLDVSRLIWRRWTGRLPTGIDRVCLAYLQHFGPSACAVIQFRRFRRILNYRQSRRLFELLLGSSRSFKPRLASMIADAAIRSQRSLAGQIYLNVGHTGLNSPYLGPWLAARGLRPVFLIHDLIPITHPEFCRPGEAARHRERMINALNSASGVIVNSRDTGRELADFAQREALPVPPCVVAWLGTEEIPRVTRRTDARPYFVMVGTIEARKNHLLVLDVWRDLVARLGDRAPELVIIGQRGWEAEEAIARLDQLGAMASHVRELGRCDDATMHRLIANAQAVLMPSFIEGYGLPLVEALKQAVPVIATDLPVFREIAGDIPTYLPAVDRQRWVDTILIYSEDGAERQRQMRAIDAFRAPEWVTHFALVEEFIETL